MLTRYEIIYVTETDKYALWYQPSYSGAEPVLMDVFDEREDATAYIKWLEVDA